MLSQEEINRFEILSIANQYATYRWVATEAHKEHSGRLHTPDAMTVYDSVHNHGGWWIYGENVGIPYFGEERLLYNGLD
jgi:hypothetical protein